MTHAARTDPEYIPQSERRGVLLNTSPEEKVEAPLQDPPGAPPVAQEIFQTGVVETAPRAALGADKPSKHVRGRASKKTAKPRDRKISSIYQCYKQARREANEPALSYRLWLGLRAERSGTLQWRYQRELRRRSL